MGRNARRGRPPHPGPFTPAEQRVLDLLRHGQSNAEIAVALGVTVHAVKFHVSNMLAKTGATTREELAAWRPPAGTGPRSWFRAALAPAATVKVAASVAVISVGVAGMAVVLAAMGDSQSTAPPAAASTSAATPDPVPTLRASLAVTSYQLTQREVVDVRVPGAPSHPRLEQVVTYSVRPDGESAIQTTYVTPSQPPRSVVVRGTTRWHWGPDIPVIATTFADARFAGAMHPADRQRADLREMAAAAAGPNRTAALAGLEDIAGRRAIVIRISEDRCADPGSADMAGPLTLWVDEETLFLLKYEQRSREDGRITMLTEVTSTAYNLPLPDSAFAIPTDRQILVSSAPNLSNAGATVATGLAPLSDAGCVPVPDSVAWVTPASGLSQLVIATPTP